MNSLKKSFLLAADVIKKAKNILLIPHAKMDCDGMSSAIALHDILTKMGKNPTAVCPDPVPEAFKFLPSTEIFTTEISESTPSNSLLLTLNTGDKKFSDLQYEVQDGKVNIIISSENSPFEEADFSFVEQSLQPDLIICLDSGDTKQLGKIYDDNTELFSSIPVLNIDHHISNTQFGTVNLVEMKNSSTTEIIYDLLPYIDERGHDLISEDIATLLLAGLITDTGSFQHSNTTPKSLDTAAELIELGARQQEIITHLFKTKSLATLRLWGRILTQLKNDPMYRMVWSSVSKEDLQDTLAHSEDAEGLIDELLSTTPGTEMVFLVKEREDGLISTSIRTSSSLVDATLFAGRFGGGGHRQAAGFKIRERGGKSFEEIVADIISEGKKFQAERLGLPLPVGNITELTALTDSQPDTPEMHPNVENTLESQEDLFPELPEVIAPEISENIPEETEEHEETEEPLFLETSPAEEFIKNDPIPKAEILEIPEISQEPEKIVESFADMLDMEEPNQIEHPVPEKIISPLQTAEADLPDFLKPENIEDTFTTHAEHVEVREEREKKEENLLNSSEDDEFAMFLANAQEKKEDDKFDTAYHQAPQNTALSGEESSEEHSLDSIFEDQFSAENNQKIQEVTFNANPVQGQTPEPVFETPNDDFLSFLNQEEEKKLPPAPVVETPNEEFGDDFLAALKEENPDLSPIETPTPEIFEIEKPSQS